MHRQRLRYVFFSFEITVLVKVNNLDYEKSVTLLRLYSTQCRRNISILLFCFFANGLFVHFGYDGVLREGPVIDWSEMINQLRTF